MILTDTEETSLAKIETSGVTMAAENTPDVELSGRFNAFTRYRNLISDLLRYGLLG